MAGEFRNFLPTRIPLTNRTTRIYNLHRFAANHTVCLLGPLAGNPGGGFFYATLASITCR